MDISLVNQYIGIPYKHMGRDKSGLDCWGLVKLIYKDILDIVLWDIGEEYPENWSFKGKDLFMENYRKQWKRVTEPQTWDVVLLRNGGEVINHAGVMLKKGTFIHCIKTGVVLSDVSEKIWKPQVAGFYRYKNDNA